MFESANLRPLAIIITQKSGKLEMKKWLTLLLGLIIVHSINAQIITSRNFRNTEWFSDNTDSLFFNSDTVTLIKYSNIYDYGSDYTIYFESESLNDAHCVHFQFNRHGNMHFWIKDFHMATISKEKERTWLIERKTGELRIFRNGVLEFTLTPISSREIRFYERNQEFFTTEFTMLKNFRQFRTLSGLQFP